MKKNVLTYDDVAVAATLLLGKQEELTVDNIREVIGTGNRFLIERFLNKWLVEQRRAGMPVSTRQEPEEEPSEPVFPEEILCALESLWVATSEHSGRAIVEIKEETTGLMEHCTDLMESLDEARISAEQRSAALESELQETRETLKRLETRMRSEITKRNKAEAGNGERLTALEQAVADLGKNLSAQGSRIGAAETAIASLNGMASQVQELAAGIQQTNEGLEAVNARLERLDNTFEALSKELETVTKRGKKK